MMQTRTAQVYTSKAMERITELENAGWAVRSITPLHDYHKVGDMAVGVTTEVIVVFEREA